MLTFVLSYDKELASRMPRKREALERAVYHLIEKRGEVVSFLPNKIQGMHSASKPRRHLRCHDGIWNIDDLVWFAIPCLDIPNNDGSIAARWQLKHTNIARVSSWSSKQHQMVASAYPPRPTKKFPSGSNAKQLTAFLWPLADQHMSMSSVSIILISVPLLCNGKAKSRFSVHQILLVICW